MKGQGDRSLPRSMSETGRRSVGNRKEHRLRCDYASSPDKAPCGVWGGSPHRFPHREAIQKESSQGAKRYLTG